MELYAEKIYVLVHRCHEQCLKLMHADKQKADDHAGINTRQGIILKYLLDEDGMTQKELTERLQITSSSCGELLIKLAQRGYLERRASAADKRTFTVHLTESGRDLGQYYKQKSIVELEEWASGLTQQEREQLYHLLEKLSTGLDTQIMKGIGEQTD